MINVGLCNELKLYLNIIKYSIFPYTYIRQEFNEKQNRLGNSRSKSTINSVNTLDTIHARTRRGILSCTYTDIIVRMHKIANLDFDRWKTNGLRATNLFPSSTLQAGRNIVVCDFFFLISNCSRVRCTHVCTIPIHLIVSWRTHNNNNNMMRYLTPIL